MPFIGTERIRQLEKREILPEKVGDLCALVYKPMVEKWFANPSWTTWSRIRLEGRNGTWKHTYLDSRAETWNHLFTHEEAQNQVEAALEVFYDLYVHDYEIEKLRVNGGVINEKD